MWNSTVKCEVAAGIKCINILFNEVDNENVVLFIDALHTTTIPLILILNVRTVAASCLCLFTSLFLVMSFLFCYVFFPQSIFDIVDGVWESWHPYASIGVHVHV